MIGAISSLCRRLPQRASQCVSNACSIRNLHASVCVRQDGASGAPANCLMENIYRSVLFIPGSNTKALQKLVDQPESIPADAFILDLEDAVAPAAKNEARENIKAMLSSGGLVSKSKKIIIRVNGIGTEWYEADVAAVAGLAPHITGTMLPKAESASQITALAEALPTEVHIWACVETPKGVLCVDNIAAAAQSVNLTAIVAGTSDLVKDMRARHTADRLPLLTSLSMMVLAARAYGLTVLDGVHLDIKDVETLKSICLQGRDMGFDGKTAIHPAQLSIINEAYSPSLEEIAHSRKLVNAYAEALAAGGGVAVVDGKLVEHLHVAEAKRILALADRLTPRPQ